MPSHTCPYSEHESGCGHIYSCSKQNPLWKFDNGLPRWLDHPMVHSGSPWLMAGHTSHKLDPLYTSQLNPNIDALPNEILTSIFHLTITDQPGKAISLLLVCQRWYHLIMSESSLWSNFYIGCYQGIPQEAYIQATLARTAQAPLNITFDFSRFDFEVTGEDSARELGLETVLARRNVTLLKGASDCLTHRWRSLRIILPLEDHIISERLLSCFEGIETPELIALRIERGADISSEGDLPTSPLFIFAPRLMRLDTMFTDLRRITLSPNSLTEFHAHIDRDCSTITALVEQTELVSLSLINICDSPSTVDATLFFPYYQPRWQEAWMNTITFDNLVNLILSGFFPDWFYSSCRFPKLRNLEVHGTYALDLFSKNSSFFASVQKITLAPPISIRYLICRGDGRYDQAIVDKLSAVGYYNFPSVMEMVLPKSCLELVYPTLAASIKGSSEFTEGCRVLVMVKTGIIKLKI